MKNKKISKLVAGTLTATVALNFCSGNIKNISAYAGRNSSNLEESNASSNSDNRSNQTNDLSKTSGVSIEQMQEDFKNIAGDSNDDNDEEEIVNDGAEVDYFGINSNLEKLISTLSESESYSVKPRANYFATFSFDGENAGKIIIINTNLSPTAEIRYSLDGGNTWTNTLSHEIQLSQEEINSITADKDIIVGLVKLESYKETIDIQSSAAPNVSTVYKNDLEDRFFGNIDYLEYSLDEGSTWHDYTNETKFDGDKVVNIRYKAHGTVLASDSAQFTFAKSTDNDTRKYIPISQVSLHTFCSQENNGYSDAKNMIDGNGNTLWHNNWKGDNDLYYSVKFSDVKFITEIEYLPQTGSNGRLRSGQILTSYDGENWDVACTFNDLQNNANLQKIKLPEPVATRYIKIQATKTWGNVQDVFFTGRMLNFYEDTTQNIQTEPLIKYSTTENTNNYVIAKLVLPEGFSASVKTHKFLNNGTYDFEYTDDKGQKHTITATVNNIVRGDLSKGVYLSTLDYSDGSYVGYGSIKKDKNPDGGAISLIVDGSKMTFSKGLGAHATSSLIYDIEAFSSEYTKFSTYVGVDSSRGSNGSVKFTISASNDGKQWTTLKTTNVLNGNSNAVYVDVDVTGYTYLRLYADENGGNASDHSVYADARLVKADYNINGEYYTGFKTIAEYDDSISSRSVEENYKNYKKEVLEREFVNRIGYNNILTASRDIEGVSEALAWLQSDQEALQLFIEAGGYYSGTGYNAIVALGKLYNEYKDDMGNIIYKKMLLGTAAAYSKNLKTFLVNYGGNCREANPVETYKNFKTLYNNGLFVRKSEFESYSMELVRAVMDARINYDEMFWLRDYIEKKYPSSTHINNWVRYNGYGYMGYVNTGYDKNSKPRFYDEAYKEEWDKKYNFLKYGISYGETNLYRIWMFMEAGSICWGLSGLGMVVNEVQGIPAIGTFQPGHEAYLLYSQNSEGKGIWSISDNVGGWKSSYSRWGSTTQTEHRLMLGWGQMEYNTVNGGNNTTYTLLAQDALNDYSNYLNSMFYNLIANSYEKNTTQHEEALNDSLGCYSKNLDSMYGLYKSYLEDESTTDKEWVELARKVATEYRYFPAPMVDLLKLIKAQVEDTILQIEVDMLQTDSLKKASVATSKESLQDGACREIANSLLGNNAKDLASFSFDGENANTILINDSYADSTIQVRVSLDGGDTWEKFENDQTFTMSHSIKLTDEQVSRINATDDILVGLMGVTENFTIDIKDATTISGSVYVNDDENLLLGNNLNSVEYSIDGGQTWQDYDGSGVKSETRIEGDVTAQFRYKAHGLYLQGIPTSYKFTANNDSKESKYLELKHVSLYQYSSQNSDTINHAAKNFIDGVNYTAWHTTYNVVDPKYYVVEFDQVRYISKLTYLPGGSSNGRIKSGEIYTSMDGENWTLVHEFSGLQNNTNLQTIDFGNSFEAKYLKLVATETYGNSSWESNMYCSGKMLNFYEDTTKTYVADVSIDYSTTSPTSDKVTATLVLPEGCEVIGDSEHVFEDNGTFEFKYTDANGVEHSIEAKVTWIHNESSELGIEYSTTEPTNKDVVATLTGLREGDTIVNNNGSALYTFDKNETFEFIVRNQAGKETKILAEVTWIDKDAPTADVVYSTEELTNKSVVAKLENFSEEDVTVVNNDGKTEYTFDKNGKFEFIIQDKAGNQTKIPVEVTWIDKEGPNVTIEYSTTELTNQDVVATLKGLEEGDVVVNNDGKTSHTFTENGTFEFIVRDKLGNETKISATVNCIDKIAPKADVVYSTEELTNKDVVVKLENFSEEGVVVVNNDGKTSYTFTENGTFEFIIQDKAGNQTIIPVAVNWIDKGGPVVNVSYSTKKLTNEDVIVTLEGLEEGDIVVNNDGKTSYTFTENGSFEFIVRDTVGNETKVPVVVNWIDKVAPTASIQYSVDSWTDEDVIAQLVGLSEEVTILNTEVVDNSYIFKENGEFKFEFVDRAGNKGEVVAKVNWIDKTKPEETIIFSETIETKDPVTVTLNINTDEVEILNNNGLATFTFLENGVFIFKLRLRSTGYEFEYPITVDWIKEDNNSTVGNGQGSNSGNNNSTVGNGQGSNSGNNNSTVGNGQGSNSGNNNSTVGNGQGSNNGNNNSTVGNGQGSNNGNNNSTVGNGQYIDESYNTSKEEIDSDKDIISDIDKEETSNKDENKSETNSNANENKTDNNESKKTWKYVAVTSLSASLIGAFLWIKKIYFTLIRK